MSLATCLQGLRENFHFASPNSFRFLLQTSSLLNSICLWLSQQKCRWLEDFRSKCLFECLSRKFSSPFFFNLRETCWSVQRKRLPWNHVERRWKRLFWEYQIELLRRFSFPGVSWSLCNLHRSMFVIVTTESRFRNFQLAKFLSLTRQFVNSKKMNFYSYRPAITYEHKTQHRSE